MRTAAEIEQDAAQNGWQEDVAEDSMQQPDGMYASDLMIGVHLMIGVQLPQLLEGRERNKAGDRKRRARS